MEFAVLVIIAVLFATGGAFKAGTKTAFSRAARNQAKNDLVRDAVTGGKGGGIAHKAGTKAGGVVISGLGLIRRAFAQGWRQSWDNGKQTTMKWFNDVGYKVGSPVDRRGTEGGGPGDHGQVEAVARVGRYTVRWSNGQVQTVKASHLRVCVGHETPDPQDPQDASPAFGEDTSPDPAVTVPSAPPAPTAPDQGEPVEPAAYIEDRRCPQRDYAGLSFSAPCGRAWAADASPERPYCDRHMPAATTSTEGPPMAIETATHGEIHTIPQLLTELDAIVAEAAAELEDAAGDKTRAQEDMRRIEMMVISAQNFELDTTSLTLLQSLIEPAKERSNLADRRKATAEHRHGTAIKTRDTVKQKHAGLQDAHDAAGRDAATKEAYART